MGCSANVMVPTPTVTDNYPVHPIPSHLRGQSKKTLTTMQQLQLTGDFTVEARFRITTLFCRLGSLRKQHKPWYGLWYHPTSNLLLFQVYASGGAAYNALVSFTPSLNTWYHVMEWRTEYQISILMEHHWQQLPDPLHATNKYRLINHRRRNLSCRHIGQIECVRIWKTAPLHRRQVVHIAGISRQTI